MQHTPRIFAAASVAAFLSLSACNQPETVTVNNVYDPQAEALANAQPVELPPAIAASRTYRCADNSLLYAEFYTNNTVNVRVGDKAAAPAVLTAAADDAPYLSDGYSLSDNAKSVSFKAPGKGTQDCTA